MWIFHYARWNEHYTRPSVPSRVHCASLLSSVSPSSPIFQRRCSSLSTVSSSTCHLVSTNFLSFLSTLGIVLFRSYSFLLPIPFALFSRFSCLFIYPFVSVSPSHSSISPELRVVAAAAGAFHSFSIKWMIYERVHIHKRTFIPSHI